MRTRSIAVGISAVSLVVTVVATIVGAGVTSGASTAQRAAFIVTWCSILIGIAAGLVGAFASETALRKVPLRWAAANFLVGLACFALELLAAVDNM